MVCYYLIVSMWAYCAQRCELPMKNWFRFFFRAHNRTEINKHQITFGSFRFDRFFDAKIKFNFYKSLEFLWTRTLFKPVKMNKSFFAVIRTQFANYLVHFFIPRWFSNLKSCFLSSKSEWSWRNWRRVKLVKLVFSITSCFLKHFQCESLRALHLSCRISC